MVDALHRTLLEPGYRASIRDYIRLVLLMEELDPPPPPQPRKNPISWLVGGVPQQLAARIRDSHLTCIVSGEPVSLETIKAWTEDL
jgi:hypothetical protein